MPRRICPACQRRYAGLVDPECPVCQGTGVLGLGAAALSTAEPSAVARAVELYLERKARDAARLPHDQHAHAIADATTELVYAGVLAHPIRDAGIPAHVAPPTGAPAERGRELAARLGVTVDPMLEASLRVPAPGERPDTEPRIPGATARTPRRPRSALTTLTNPPADPLADPRRDEVTHAATEHRARVVDLAAAELSTRRERAARRARRAPTHPAGKAAPTVPSEP